MFVQGTKEKGFNCSSENSRNFIASFDQKKVVFIDTDLCVQMKPWPSLLKALPLCLRELVLRVAMLFSVGRISAEHKAAKFVAERFVNPDLAKSTGKPATNYDLVYAIYQMCKGKKLVKKKKMTDLRLLNQILAYFKVIFPKGGMKDPMGSVEWLYTICVALEEIFETQIFNSERLFYSDDVGLLEKPILAKAFTQFTNVVLSLKDQKLNALMAFYDLYAVYHMCSYIVGEHPTRDPATFSKFMKNYFTKKNLLHIYHF